MRILVVVAARKYSGAGAAAELTCRALRAAGGDARLLFLAGRNLEQRLADEPWALPHLERERSPARLRSNLAVLREAAAASDAVLCHLPHDHLLCLAAGLRRSLPLVRSFRHPCHLARDPFSRFLARRCDGAVVPSAALGERFSTLLRSPTPWLRAVVPVEDRFRPMDGRRWRDHLGIGPAGRVVGAVGKLDAGRGFGRLLEIGSALPPDVHLLPVGHGPLEGRLAARAAALGIAGRVHWVGYHEEELPALYAAMDVPLFLEPGSDWGHRMISEAQACGRPVVAVAHEGVADLVEDGRTGTVVARDTVAVTAAVVDLLDDPERARRIGTAAAAASDERRLEPAGNRLLDWLRAQAR